MGDYILGIAGIVLSVVLFLVGYRQTVGAKRERVNAANAEVERIIVRRIFSDSYTLRLTDVSRILEGKARDFRVRTSDLLTESQMLAVVYTRIMESDFIAEEQRGPILERIMPVVNESEDASAKELRNMEVVPAPQGRIWITTALTAIMGVAASVLGTLVAFLPNLRDLRFRWGGGSCMKRATG
ncbi:MAG: hypothetical protein AVDCRST_MAG93-9155 [uncultured Chloroflexia bacterium]|uniref:Uncharacterized protein n=1 Tax=uncultured Chloroflexia bacterium TaxID=1672391 RepID=A0A6J4NEQ6_9CHLR|nr:MAG: hypothetical protein AVDCRST_MAG93-9155 [uncultured Chloroflexia bacterium]